MISYPRLKTGARSRQVIDIFKGYHHNLRIGSGEFYEMENLTSDDYPVLSVRKKRGFVTSLKYGCSGMHYVPGTGLFYLENIDGSSVLYLLSSEGVSTEIVKLNLNPKRFALIGKRLVIAPDMLWVDIETRATGSLDETWGVYSGNVTVKMCDADGNYYTNVTVSPEPPSAPGYHELWLCNAVGSVGLNQYEPATSEWVAIASTYLKIAGLGDHYFNTGDGVTISGLTDAAKHLNGSHVIQYAGHGDIVISGVIFEEHTQECSHANVTIERTAPKLDFVVECGNRLWGCKKDTNEIYACKLGDPYNWNCFQGLSTDSWVGSIGTPDEFTGAAVQNGHPVFYKENCKHKVWPSATGAHQITAVTCNGVEKGSESSLAVLDGTVYYKSPFGICADDGGGITKIGEDLGGVSYKYAYATIFNRKYYLNMMDYSYKRHLFVYDIDKRIWHVEDSPLGRGIAAGGGRLYSASNNALFDLTGSAGTPEETVSWMAVTGDLGLEIPEQKYISRLTLRLCLEPGATLELYAQYDREAEWVKLGQVYGTDLRSFSLPVRPRRCDQLRLKLQGTGMCKIYSITKTLEKGSELA